MGEFDSIAEIKAKFASLVSSQMEGIGDDCATLFGSPNQLFTTDILVEGVHFLRDSITPRELGRKSLSVSLSDVAAMGGTAQSSFLCVALPQSVDSLWYQEFIEGYREVSLEYGVPLLGGDTSRSLRDIVINVLVTGTVAAGNRKCRAAGQSGDFIFVSSELGNAAAGLKLLLQPESVCTPECRMKLVQAQNNPTPDMALGALLGTMPEVHAMMDVSDGVASDLKHILDSSGLGAQVELDKIPISEELATVCRDNGWDSMSLALEGGEDYCLLFTASEDIGAKIESCTSSKIYCIGRLTDEWNGVRWVKDGESQSRDFRGFTHF